MNDLEVKISRMLNVFENDSGSPETDYKSIYIYHDGNNKRRQVTLARGFTDDGGNLKKVVQRYIALGGKLSKVFQSRLDKFATGVLVNDQEFIKALSDAAAEPVMRQAQDEVFISAYLAPAFRWAATNRFVLPLSQAVICDSFLHSGTVPEWLTLRFSERKPSSGGNERQWIIAYLGERLAWFQRVTGALHNAQYRPKFFLKEIERGNWNFNSPLIANGSRFS